MVTENAPEALTCAYGPSREHPPDRRPCAERGRSRGEELFRSSVELVRGVLEATGRRGALSAHEVEDFVSWAQLKLIENDYRVLRLYSGRCALSTYLRTVARRLLLDYRNSLWGKWRPSACARRMGPEAVALERLRARDGFSFDEAVSILQHNPRIAMSRDKLERLAELLPPRVARRQVNEGALVTLAVDRHPGEAMEDEERARTARKATALLGDALDELSDEDRLLLSLHFREGRTIAAIAAKLGVAQRSLYSRRDRCLRLLKRYLERFGLTRSEVFDMLGRANVDLRVSFERPSRPAPVSP